MMNFFIDTANLKEIADVQVTLQLLKQPLTDAGLAKFLEDWRRGRK
jgi:transaldolase